MARFIPALFALACLFCTHAAHAAYAVYPISGSGQVVAIGQLAPVLLQARAFEPGGVASPGAVVLFASACATFGGSGTAVTIADATGLATAPAQFRAGSVAGACAINVQTPGGPNPAPAFVANIYDPAQLQLFVPRSMVTTVNQPFNFPVEASVPGGMSLAGLVIEVESFPGGHSGVESMASTVALDASGRALVSGIANRYPGNYRIGVHAGALAQYFTVQQVGQPPGGLFALGGAALTPAAGDHFTFQVRIADAGIGGPPIPDALVAFSVESAGPAGATLFTGEGASDALGFVTGHAVANDSPGRYVIRVSYGVLSIAIEVENRARTFASAPSLGNGGEVTLTTFGPVESCTIASLRQIDPLDDAVSAASRSIPQGLQAPFGYVGFALRHCPGATIAVGLQFPSAIPAGAQAWLFGRTSPDDVPHWYPVAGRFRDSLAQLEFVDGQLGDDAALLDGDIQVPLFAVLANATTPSGVPSVQDLWWGGGNEDGWGMSIVQHNDVLFSLLFVYDAQGEPVWYSMSGGAWNESRTAYTGALYLPHSAPYFAYDVARFRVGAPVGQATIMFADPRRATLDYTIDGITARKDITRMAFGPRDPTNFGSYGDLWWGGPSQDGWGVAILQQYATLFSVWFTYDAAGAPRWFAMPSGSWTDLATYEGRLYRSHGDPWVGRAYSPALLQTVDVGAFRLRFGNNAATMDYLIDGRAGALPLVRLPF